jgi:cell division septum initiation protein DivIVA
MSNNDVINREEILGASAKSYTFDKVLRGYDTKQVDEYIINLKKSNKTASELFDNRIKDLKNEKDMLESELEHTKSEFDRIASVLENVKKERDEYKLKSEKEKKVVVQADNSQEIAELEGKLEKALTKNRLLGEENKKLTDQNRDLQRDVAHLTKKVDKNRSKINELNTHLEEGMTSDESKKNSEIAQIYESAIDKAEDLIYRLQTEFSLAHSKAEDIKG